MGRVKPGTKEPLGGVHIEGVRAGGDVVGMCFDAPNLPARLELPPALIESCGPLVKRASMLIINSEATAGEGADLAKMLKGLVDQAEMIRKAKTEPLDRVKKLIMDEAKAFVAPLEQVRVGLRQRLLTWESAKAEAAAAERERIQREAEEEAEALRREEEKKLARLKKPESIEAAKLEAARKQAVLEAERNAALASVMEPTAGARGMSASAGVRETWEWEIEDAERIPRQLLVVDTGLVKAAIKAMEGQGQNPRIAGLRLFRKQHLNVR